MSSIRSIARQLEPFSKLTGEEFADLIRRSLAMTVPKGETLCACGASADAAYVLLEGEVVEQWPDGIVTYGEPGAILIPSALLSDHPCGHDWQVTADAKLLRISRGDFEHMLAGHSAAAQSILMDVSLLLAHQLRDLNRAFNELQKNA